MNRHGQQRHSRTTVEAQKRTPKVTQHHKDAEHSTSFTQWNKCNKIKPLERAILAMRFLWVNDGSLYE